MKKLVLILSVLLVAVFCCSYTLDGVAYLTVDSNVGEQVVYVPISSMEDSFTLDSNGLPVNITGSSITGYTLDGSGSRYYRVTLSPYGEEWTYRLNSSGYTTETFTVTKLIDTNINFVTSSSIMGNRINYNIVLIGIVGMGVVICFMKK